MKNPLYLLRVQLAYCLQVRLRVMPRSVCLDY